eukprot:TRINITY_DN4216_c0_g1_i7.p1 TRINITY_DN4216_c0_g1~~TRINITY_DN4216_c0_g1_i7.p1  ORF type:complete len:303 (+),score=74.62 TRINITY_DN4216_c0_g1_i7:110-1018(+)
MEREDPLQQTNAHLLPIEKIFSNINTEHEITFETQQKLMTHNCLFMIQLAGNLNISFSVTSLAVHLCNYFFNRRCYLYYDRYVVASSCLLLANKIKDGGDIRLNNIATAYHKTLVSLENKTELLDDTTLNKIKDKLSKTEIKVLQTLDYDFDFDIPYPHIYRIYNKYFKDEPDPEKKIYHLSRAICLDIYKTYAPLVYPSTVIALTAIITACFLLNFELPPSNFQKLRAAREQQKTEDTRMTDEAPDDVEKKLNEEKGDKGQDKKLLSFIDWIEDIDKTINLKDILEVQNLLYDFINTYQSY